MGDRQHGMDLDRLGRITEVVNADVERERYDGAVVLVARHGEVVYHEAIGCAERATGRPSNVDDVFHLFSITKTFTAIALLQRVDRGDIQLFTPVAEVIPEFATKGKQHVTIVQLLTHTAGLPAATPPMDPALTGDTTAVALAVADQPLQTTPGRIVSYSPIGAFAVLGEIVRRLDGGTRAFRQILEEDLFAPLGMANTSLSLRPDLADRRAPVVVRDWTPAIIPPEALEGINVIHHESFEMPGGGALGTAHDLFRFGDALRGGGALGGSRVLSSALMQLAVTNHTGLEVNHIFDGMCAARGWEPFPAYLGLGFFLRGEGIFPMPFGATASSGTFGGLGAGSTMFWVDPERDVVFVCLTTGTLEDSRNFERMHQLSDLALAAVVD
ncbi:MAG TPA: serine hydrolase domain-containing protein [Dehalococcoidia bacterium]|nr:serine hydrolase domain-containing protein [Dehalococcoidia bacterium]